MIFSIRRFLLILGISYWICTSNSVHAKVPLPIFSAKPGEHIVLSGNTFADRMHHYNYFEVLLQKNVPIYNLTLRNVGWSADEVGLQPRSIINPGKSFRLYFQAPEEPGAYPYCSFPGHWQVMKGMLIITKPE